MRVIVSRDALDDIERTDAWWRENRPDGPDLVRAEVATAIESLSTIGSSLPVFRRVRGAVFRRLHVSRIHRHLYVVTDERRIVVLAVWGAVRAVLPALRVRLGRLPHTREP